MECTDKHKPIYLHREFLTVPTYMLNHMSEQSTKSPLHYYILLSRTKYLPKTGKGPPISLVAVTVLMAKACKSNWLGLHLKELPGFSTVTDRFDMHVQMEFLLQLTSITPSSKSDFIFPSLRALQICITSLV